MTEDPQIEHIADLARQHADNLARDINNASTRIEHLRLTTLALEAERLAMLLEARAAASHVG